MAITYKLITKQELSSNVATVDITNIPGTYTDLMLICSTRSDIASWWITSSLRINDVSSQYSTLLLGGNNSSVFSNQDTLSQVAARFISLGNTSNNAAAFANVCFYFPSYSQNNISKTFSVDGSTSTTTSGNYYVTSHVNWASTVTSPITKISFIDAFSGTNYMSGSKFYLYGIKN